MSVIDVKFQNLTVICLYICEYYFNSAECAWVIIIGLGCFIGNEAK